MATSTSRLAFTDCFSVFDRALASAEGIRISFSTEGDAKHFRTRLHSARAIHRNDNAETYPAEHPMHGHSEYDSLVVKLRSNGEGHYLYIEPTTTKSIEIEDIAAMPAKIVLCPQCGLQARCVQGVWGCDECDVELEITEDEA
jgi:hypothetical protein